MDEEGGYLHYERDPAEGARLTSNIPVGTTNETVLPPILFLLREKLPTAHLSTVPPGIRVFYTNSPLPDFLQKLLTVLIHRG